jgi:O-antigen/teichoic acid export membrane protein
MSKTDENYNPCKELVSGGGAVFITVTISYILTFFYKLILARHLGPADYGYYAMIITITSFFTIFSCLGLSDGLVRFIPLYSSKKEYINGYLKIIKLIQTVTSLSISFLLILSAKEITTFFGFSKEFIDLLYISALMVPLKVFINSYTAFIISFKKTFISKFGENIVFSFVLLVGSIFLLIFDLDVKFAVICLLIAYIIIFIYYKINSKKLIVKTEEEKYELKRWFKYSTPLLFASVVGYLINWTDNLVIGKFLTESELGIYSVAFSIAFYLFMGPKLFSGIFLPVMTKYYEEDKLTFKKVFNQLRLWALYFSLIVGSVFIIFSKQILNILFGKEYVPGHTSVIILSISFILTSYFYYSEQLLQLNDKTTKILLVDILVLILNVAITIPLVNTIGITGAAIGSAISYFLTRFIIHEISKKYIKIKHDYKQIFKMVTAVFSSISLSYIISTNLRDFFNIHNYIYIIIAGITYMAFLTITVKEFKIAKDDDLIIIDVIEKYTKKDLTFVKKIFVK